MRRFAIVFLCLFAVLSACSKSGNAAGRPTVAVSIFPVYDLARRIAGPDADVVLFVPPGHDVQAFEPTPKETESASKAKLGVMVGLGLDTWMEKLMTSAAPKARLLTVGDRVPSLTQKDDDGHETSNPDPYCWLDPERARLIVRAIAEELGRADGAHAVAYRERATALDTALAALDKEIEERTKAFKVRGFVSFHGSFGYFAERYKLEVLGVVESSPGVPPTGAQMQKLLAVVKDKHVTAVFSEPQIDAAPAKQLADEAKITLGVLDPIGGGADTDSYEKMMRFDVAALEKVQSK